MRINSTRVFVRNGNFDYLCTKEKSMRAGVRTTAPKRLYKKISDFMSLWFECKVRYDKTMENGAIKKVNEPYLVDALSFTEAEARIIEERTPYISGEFTVSAVKKTRIAEIFADPSADERYFMCKVNFISFDEKTNAEKKTSTLILVQANDFASALNRLNEGFKGSAADYEIASITESPIMEVYNAK